MSQPSALCQQSLSQGSGTLSLEADREKEDTPVEIRISSFKKSLDLQSINCSFLNCICLFISAVRHYFSAFIAFIYLLPNLGSFAKMLMAIMRLTVRLLLLLLLGHLLWSFWALINMSKRADILICTLCPFYELIIKINILLYAAAAATV